MEGDWFRGQVVFLTGATGTLGGCLLYKLAIQLPTARIFVLVRGSIGKAIEAWEQLMPEQIDEVMATGKIQFCVGDMAQPNLGLSPANLSSLQDEVTVVINAAGAIALSRDLAETIQVNCTAHLALAALLGKFAKLQRFLHVSTTSVHGFLPNGILKEQLYPLYENPKDELAKILSTGQSSHIEQFVAPYALAKHLAECLLLSGDYSFPILVVRPSLVGPAIKDPFPFYGSDGAIPVHTFLQVLLGDSKHGLVKLEEALSPTVPFDEIPVDLVARTCLAHLARETTGIVHACADLYVYRTFGEFVDRLHQYTPENLMDEIRNAGVRQNEAIALDFFNMAQQHLRDQHLDCTRSVPLKQVAGPMGLDLGGHDPEAFIKRRIERLSKFILQQLKNNKFSDAKVA